jgi:hypothetical protein
MGITHFNRRCEMLELSSNAKAFRDMYITIMIQEALALTVKEDREETIKNLEAEYEGWTFRDVAQQALLDGFIESMDEIYEE